MSDSLCSFSSAYQLLSAGQQTMIIMLFNSINPTFSAGVISSLSHLSEQVCCTLCKTIFVQPL